MKKTAWFALAFAAVPLVAHAEADKKTERLWKAKCASCHGVDGKGKTDQGEKMAIGDLTGGKAAEAEIKKAITDGVNREKNGKKQEMEPYKDKLSAEQIDQLVAYIKALK